MSGVDHGPGGRYDPVAVDLVDLKAIMNRWQEGLADVGWNSLYWNNHDQPRAVSRFGSDEPAHRVRSAKLLGTVLHLHRGTPYVYQGEELGMTNHPFTAIEQYDDVESRNFSAYATSRGQDPDDVLVALAKQSRDHARTPMQWDDGPNAGFTAGTPWLPVNPNHVEINAAAQVDDPESVYAHYRALIGLRHDLPVVADGAFEMLAGDHPRLYAFTRRLDDDELLVLANFSDDPLEVDVADVPDLADWADGELVLGNAGTDGGTTASRPAGPLGGSHPPPPPIMSVRGASRRIVGIEAGGTKIVCATGSGPDDLSVLHRFPTTTPDETIAGMVDFVRTAQQAGPVDAVGLATFGPVDLDPTSGSYGHVTTTPKAGWQGTDVVGDLVAATGVPVAFDTDVNGAAIAEHRWGAGAGTDNLVYFTVGTGVGGGVIVAGRPVHGMLHPEVGHLTVRRHPDDDFEGSCRFHGDCLEGLAAGPSIEARFGRPGEELDAAATDRAVAIVSSYLAQAVAAVAYVVSPQRVVMGGGVLGLAGMMTAVRGATQDLLAGQLVSPLLDPGLTTWLVPPGLDDRAGVLGAVALGLDAVTADLDSIDDDRPASAGAARGESR